jgi:hypothetical protein
VRKFALCFAENPASSCPTRANLAVENEGLHQRGQVDADRIWRLLNLQLWGDLYFTGRREGALESQAAYQ